MMSTKFGQMKGLSKTAVDLGSRLDAILAQRLALEAKMFKASDKAADINRRTDPDGYEKARAAVEDLKQQIDQVAREHAAMAMAFTVAAGGQLVGGPEPTTPNG